MKRSIRTALGLMVLTATAALANTNMKAPDLSPLKSHRAPEHAPVILSEKGKAKAVIVLRSEPVQNRSPQRGWSSVFNAVSNELRDALSKSCGTSFRLLKGKEAKVPKGMSAIIIGDCAESRAAGISSEDLKPESFIIKTAPGRVFIVGHDREVAPKGSGVVSKGSAWGVLDFLERFVGVRWYYPDKSGGRSLIKQPDLAIPAVHLSDTPVFRYRMIWPDVQFPKTGKGELLIYHHVFLRSDASIPDQMMHHYTSGVCMKLLKNPLEDRHFEKNGDGKPDGDMVEFSDPLQKVYLEEMARQAKAGDKLRLPHVGKTVTVSAWDHDIGAHGSHAKLWSEKGEGIAADLWANEGGRYGSASRIPAYFVRDLAKAFKQNHPDYRLGYFATMNYTLAPENLRYPGNVTVMTDVMAGMAELKEPSLMARDQMNIDKWCEISGDKVQTWFHIYRPLVQTEAPYEYPYTIQKFYQNNRDKITGSYVTGHDDYWPRQHLSLYVWIKCLWNPDIDVDAVIDEYCKRMYGKAYPSMRQLVKLKIDAWEKSRWPGACISPQAIFEKSYTREVCERMRALFAESRKMAAGDELVQKRLDYFYRQWPKFFAEEMAWRHQEPMTSLKLKRESGEIAIDGKLDDKQWRKVKRLPMVSASGKLRGGKPKNGTWIRGMWSDKGITLAFECMDKDVKNLSTPDTPANKDHYTLWRNNDNIEILLDVSGENSGDFYQIVVTAAGAIKDARLFDETWNLEGHEMAIHRTAKSWNLEIFLPYTAFEGAIQPNEGAFHWHAQFARHRIRDAGSKSENLEESRLNFRFQTSHQGNYKYESDAVDLIDFSKLVFDREGLSLSAK